MTKTTHPFLRPRKAWMPAGKREAVRLVRSGQLDRAQLMSYYSISEEEMSQWERDAATGLRALVCSGPQGNLNRKRLLRGGCG